MSKGFMLILASTLSALPAQASSVRLAAEIFCAPGQLINGSCVNDGLADVGTSAEFVLNTDGTLSGSLTSTCGAGYPVEIVPATTSIRGQDGPLLSALVKTSAGKVVAKTTFPISLVKGEAPILKVEGFVDDAQPCPTSVWVNIYPMQ
jgi:hypothetical protein